MELHKRIWTFESLQERASLSFWGWFLRCYELVDLGTVLHMQRHTLTPILPDNGILSFTNLPGFIVTVHWPQDKCAVLSYGQPFSSSLSSSCLHFTQSNEQKFALYSMESYTCSPWLHPEQKSMVALKCVFKSQRVQWCDSYGFCFGGHQLPWRIRSNKESPGMR